MLQISGRNPEAEEVYDAGKLAYTRWAESNAPEPRHQEMLVSLLANLGSLYRETKRPDRQKVTLLEAVFLGEKLVGASPKSITSQEKWFHALNELGITYAMRGEAEEAEEVWRRAETIAEGLVREHPANPEYQEQLVNVVNNLGTLWHYHWRQPAKALPFLHKALDIQERLVRDYPDVPHYWFGLSQIQLNLGQMLLTTNQLPALLEMYDRLIKLTELLHPPDKADAGSRDGLSAYHQSRADTLSRMRRYADALKAYDRALELATEARKEPLRLERTIAEGYAAVAEGRHDRAAFLARSVVDMAPRDGSALYRAALILSLVAANTEKGGQVAGTYADGAMDLLRKAAALGFFTAEGAANPRTESALDALRARDDFKVFLTDVDEKPAPGG